MFARVMAKLEQQRERELRHGITRIAGHVGHGDVSAGRRSGIHVVIAGGQHADIFQLRQLRKHAFGQLDLVDQQNVRIPGARRHLIGRRAVIARHIAQRLERAPVEIV